jgi:1-acyl-sn-glycerol-3-phosphate acyltransferase
VRKHFHAVRLSVSGQSFPPAGNEPMLIVLNHSSWWDPMIGVVLSRGFTDRDHFAVIDAGAVGRYAFFRRLGFIGIDPTPFRGAAEFLRLGESILSQANRVLWVTAQGRFADVRERPLALQSGVGHLAARLTRGVVVPLAIEYAFWNERTPEALVRFGNSLDIDSRLGWSGKKWLDLIEGEVTKNLDALNREAIARDPGLFLNLLDGHAGVGGPYDWWRRLKAWATGVRFDASHEAAMRRSSR